MKDPDSSCYCGLANQQRQTRRKQKQQSRGKQKQRRKQSGQRKKYSWRNLALDFVNPDQEKQPGQEKESSKSKQPGQEKPSSKSKQQAAPFSSMFSISRAFSPSILSHSSSSLPILSQSSLPAVSRIVGGTVAAEGSVPWQVTVSQSQKRTQILQHNM